MKTLIVGNMGSGKSHLSRAIHSELPRLHYHAIDSYRMRLGDGTMEKEAVARGAFLKAIAQPQPMLIECMGLGDLGLEVRNAVRNDQLMVIELKVPLSVCLARLAARTWCVPYPGTISTAIQLCKESHTQYEAGKINATFASSASGGIHQCPNTQPEHLPHIIHLVKQFYNEAN